MKPSSNKYLSDSEQIEDPTRLVPLLERLAKRRTPLAVQVAGHTELYSSCIVDVDRQYVQLDELLPSNGHELLLAQRSLQVIGKLDGIDICFTSTLAHVDVQDELITYYMNLPERLEYRQRRLDYRVHIPKARQQRVLIDNADDTVFEGLLYDLSHGGAGMIFPEGKPMVKPGLLQECAIELSADEWLYCAVELRYSKNIRARGRQHIGARFADLTPWQARFVGHHLNELERELLRKRAAY